MALPLNSILKYSWARKTKFNASCRLLVLCQSGREAQLSTFVKKNQRARCEFILSRYLELSALASLRKGILFQTKAQSVMFNVAIQQTLCDVSLSVCASPILEAEKFGLVQALAVISSCTILFNGNFIVSIF